MSIKEIIKDNVVNFESYRAGVMYYNVEVDYKVYQFPVRLDDIGDATLMKQDKAIYFMRYIRIAISNGEFHQIN